MDDSFIMREMTAPARHYTAREIDLARRAYFAQCTHIDHQIRLVLGALRENGLLDNTLIVFTSDHGEMLFDHQMAGGNAAFMKIPPIFPSSCPGGPCPLCRGMRDERIACLEDVMPTLLRFCGIDVPSTAEGMDLLGKKKRDWLYGEISDGPQGNPDDSRRKT